MAYLIIVESDATYWQIIKHLFNTAPMENPVFYTELTYCGILPIIQDLGNINIQNATTGETGVANLVEI